MFSTKPYAIDIDDVIADMSAVLYPALKKRYPQVTGIKTWSNFNLATLFGFGYQDFMNHIVEDGLIVSAPPVAGAVEAMWKIRDSGAQIVLITSRGYYPNAHTLTAEWLARHDVPYDDLIVVEEGKTKAESSVDKYPGGFLYMIDDNAFNLEDMKKAKMANYTILIDRPWNQHATNYKLGSSRLSSLSRFVENLAIEARRDYRETSELFATAV